MYRTRKDKRRNGTSNRELKNAKYEIDREPMPYIRELLLVRLRPTWAGLTELAGKADPLARTSLTRWYVLLKKLKEEKLIDYQDDPIPFFIKVKFRNWSTYRKWNYDRDIKKHRR